MSQNPDQPLKTTPLHGLHLALKARMVPFAGFAMPVQYELGTLKEHLHTRSAAGLFDVSHMGQLRLTSGTGDVAEVARALEALLPIDAQGLAPGRQRYGLLLNDAGGIRDDLMIANLGDSLLMVVNAATKDADEAHLRGHLASTVHIERLDRALLALQGPKAEAVLAEIAPACRDMTFMDVRQLEILGQSCIVLRAGYTGEDGFEISVPANAAVALAERLLAHADVKPIGLAARDTLRLEAGLCLYGQDITTETTPVEAALSWAIPKVRRTGGARAGGFPGAAIILAQMSNGAARVRVGLRPEGRAPVRQPAALYVDAASTQAIGTVTSGGFGPTLEAPIAMGYVPAALSAPGTRLYADVRGQRLPLTVVALPFVPNTFKRGTAAKS